MAYTFDVRTGRYRNATTGRFIAPEAVRAALDDAIDASSKHVRAITQQLRLGEVTLAEWQTAMMVEIKASQLAAVAAASGGFDQMTPARFGRAGQSIRAQYGFLQRLAEQIASGQQRMDGTLVRRAVMYVESSRKVYEAQRRAEMRVRGVARHRSVRHALDSCAECIEVAARGWVSIEDPLPLPGDRICLSHCRCVLEYDAAA